MNQSERNIPPETAEKAARHADICRTLNRIFVEKNLNYVDSFDETFKKLGIISAVTRISDKTSRLQSLCKREALVKDETIRDTLMDLANYSILAVHLSQCIKAIVRENSALTTAACVTDVCTGGLPPYENNNRGSANPTQ